MRINPKWSTAGTEIQIMPPYLVTSVARRLPYTPLALSRINQLLWKAVGDMLKFDFQEHQFFPLCILALSIFYFP